MNVSEQAPSLKPEVRACLNPEKLPMTETNWRELLSLSTRHRTASLIYFHLKRKEADSLPSGVLPAFRKAYIASAAHVAYLLERLKAIGKALAEENLVAVPLKGIDFALSLYEKPGLRDMTDLDLLIRTGDRPQVEKLLLKLGYSTIDYEFLNEWDERWHEDNDKHLLPFYSRDGLVRLELHTPKGVHFKGGSLIEREIMKWDRWEAHPSFRRFPETMYVPYLNEHILYHLLDKKNGYLIWLHDLGRLLEKKPALQSLCDQRLLAFLEKYTSYEIAGADNTPGAEENIEKAVADIISEPSPARLLNLKRYKSLKEKILYVLSVAFPSTGFMKEKYNDRRCSLVLCYAVRICRGLSFLVRSASKSLSIKASGSR